MTRDYILKGAVHSLHSAWSFLRDAVFLYRDTRYPSACVLGTIAGEHLGQCQWLLRRWRSTSPGAGPLNCHDFEAKLERDHKTMLKDGLVTLQYGGPKSLARLSQRLSELSPHEAEYLSVAEELRRSHEKIWNRAPDKFYKLRTRAQYVKPISDCKDWISLSAISLGETHDLLLNVGNCYRFIWYSNFLQEPEIVKTMGEMGLRENLEDAKSTWPPPEGDVY